MEVIYITYYFNAFYLDDLLIYFSNSKLLSGFWIIFWDWLCHCRERCTCNEATTALLIGHLSVILGYWQGTTISRLVESQMSKNLRDATAVPFVAVAYCRFSSQHQYASLNRCLLAYVNIAAQKQKLVQEHCIRSPKHNWPIKTSYILNFI